MVYFKGFLLAKFPTIWSIKLDVNMQDLEQANIEEKHIRDHW